ncbi:hypothetical protein MPSEU_000511100 [Mayamaea pseudoterrestris]|nr:hypothetical protein MPSEU_000511100 [Mayamaea pseudoterrestris]
MINLPRKQRLLSSRRAAAINHRNATASSDKRRTACRDAVLLTGAFMMLLLSVRGDSTRMAIISMFGGDGGSTAKSASYTKRNMQDSHRIHQTQQLHHYLSAMDYQSPLEQYPSLAGEDIPLPPPLQAMQTYMQQHNRHVVLTELDELEHGKHNHHTRLYTIAYMSCPHSAGNWLHYFTSTVNWAMLMNRTLLFKYMDRHECKNIRSSMEWKFESSRCETPSINTEQDCFSHILTRASWLPLYDDVASRLSWTEQTLHRIPRLATTDNVEKQRGYSNGQSPPPALDNYSHYSQFPLVAMYPWLKRLSHLHDQINARLQQLQQNETRHYLTQQLYAWGVPFFNGMVLRSCYDFAPTVKRVVRATLVKHDLLRYDSEASHGSLTDSTFSIVLHSRHVDHNNAGCLVEREQACLEAMLLQQRSRMHVSTATVPCSVTILSDRLCTINNLKVWLKHGRGSGSPTCRVIVAEHEGSALVSNTSSKHSKAFYDSILSEHGPFSDADFFVDLLLASLTARHGMIGELEPRDGNRWRTSSELVEDLVAYSRMMEYWQAKHGMSSEHGSADDFNFRMDPFLECTLADANLWKRSSETDSSSGDRSATSSGPLKVAILPQAYLGKT